MRGPLRAYLQQNTPQKASVSRKEEVKSYITWIVGPGFAYRNEAVVVVPCEVLRRFFLRHRIEISRHHCRDRRAATHSLRENPHRQVYDDDTSDLFAIDEFVVCTPRGFVYQNLICRDYLLRHKTGDRSVRLDGGSATSCITRGFMTLSVSSQLT